MTCFDQSSDLIVVDLDLLEDVVLDETVEHGAVNLAKELAGVELVLRDDDKAAVVQHVALHLVRGAGQTVRLQKGKC